MRGMSRSQADRQPFQVSLYCGWKLSCFQLLHSHLPVPAAPQHAEQHQEVHDNRPPAHAAPAPEPIFAVAVQFIHMLQRRVGEDAMKKAMERIIIGATAKLAQGEALGRKPLQGRILATLSCRRRPSPTCRYCFSVLVGLLAKGGQEGPL